jgi:quercetin dioxygenase-like cupin family protein
MNPEIGERIRFVATAADTRGALLETEQWLTPGGAVAIRHRHPEQEERFTVISGLLRVEVGDDLRILGSGESVTIAPGLAHRFSNRGDSEAHFIGQVRPALRTEELFERMAAIARREGATPNNRPGLLTMAPLLFRYRREVAAPGLPLWLQRAALAMLTALARALGKGELPAATGPDG